MIADDSYEIKDPSHAKLIENYIPDDSTNPSEQFERCYLKVSYDHTISQNVTSMMNSSIINDEFGNFTMQKCDSWVYSKEHYNETLVTEVSIFLLIKFSIIN